MRASSWLLLVVGLGCRNPFGEMCTTDVHPAVAVEVRAGGSGVSLADSARGVLRESPYVDSLRPWKVAGQLGGAFERPGTYTMEIERQGYLPWRQDGIRVEDAACHVRTVTLRAELVRAP